MLNREGKASQRTAWSTRTSHHRLSLSLPTISLPATEFPAPCTSSHAVLVPVMYLCRIRPCVARVSGVDDPATNPKKPKANKIIQNVKPAAFAHP